MNILNAEKISKTYGEKVLFDKVVLGVNKGDKIGVIGVNGTGKSTFLKIIAGIEEPDAGEIVSGRGVTVSYLAQAPQFIRVIRLWVMLLKIKIMQVKLRQRQYLQSLE